MVRVDHKREPFLVPIRNVLCMEGTVLLGLYVARTLCSRDFVGGLSSRTVVSSHSIFFTCLQLLFSHPGTAERFGGLTMARYIAHTSGVVNLLLNVRFLHLCARRRARGALVVPYHGLTSCYLPCGCNCWYSSVGAIRRAHLRVHRDRNLVADLCVQGTAFPSARSLQPFDIHLDCPDPIRHDGHVRARGLTNP